MASRLGCTRIKRSSHLPLKNGPGCLAHPDQARSTLRTQRPCIRLIPLFRLQGSGIVMTNQWINMPLALCKKVGFVPEPFIGNGVCGSHHGLAAAAAHSREAGYIYATGTVICDVACPCTYEADHTFFPKRCFKLHCRAWGPGR